MDRVEQPLKQHILSLPCVVMYMYMQFCVWRTSFYYVMIGNETAGLGDTTGVYAETFSYMLMGGFLLVPIIPWTIRMCGVLGTYHVINVLGTVAYGVALIPSLNIQVLGMIFLV